MSVTVANSRFIVPSIVKYRQFLGGISNVSELGKHLTLAAETAQMLRQTDIVRECGLLLSNFPLKEYQLIGQYYLGWLEYWNGSLVSANLFENIFEQSKTYKAKSLMTLAALSAAQGQLENEMRYDIEALKYADIPTSIKLLRGIAVVKAKEGFHKHAVRDLESILPYIRYAGPYASCQHLNSLAVELGEVGRIEEAQNVCRITLASPYVIAYPEWRETWQDLALRGYKSRSYVPVIQSFSESKIQNVLHLPERDRSEITRRSPFFQPREVTSLKDWKNKMVKEPNGDDGKDSEQATEQDLVLQIMELVAKKRFSRKQLLEIRNQLEKKKPDLSDN
jgi:tetratricopeptide (TPR) repeat protein